MEKLKSMKDSDLEKLYMENNLIISKMKAQSKLGRALDKGLHRQLVHAKLTRARVLTVMNQRRHERAFRNGGKL